MLQAEAPREVTPPRAHHHCLGRDVHHGAMPASSPFYGAGAASTTLLERTRGERGLRRQLFFSSSASSSSSPSAVDTDPAELAAGLISLLGAQYHDEANTSASATAFPASPGGAASRLSLREMKHRILIVANRLPFPAERREGDQWNLKSSPGGLVSALLGVTGIDAKWIGWPGVSVPDGAGQRTFTEALAEMRCVPVFLDEELKDQYYSGYCNNVLWPLFHYMGLPQEYMLTITRDFESQFKAYDRANKMFADIVCQHYREGDVIWCHDYHLMFLPMYLKKFDINMKVWWFLHTPFPSSAIYRTLPYRVELLSTVLHADLVGFHTYDYERHFVSACTRILGLENTPKGVEFQGRIIKVAADKLWSFPTSIAASRS